MTQFNKRYLDYTEEIKKLEIWELYLEIKAQADASLRALENVQEFGLPEYQNDLEIANEFLFICAVENKRRQIP